MIRRPRRPTLFPDPTLFRSPASRPRSRARPEASRKAHTAPNLATRLRSGLRQFRFAETSDTGTPSPRRSEEHTSELQSRQYLVCRLLLEKKKNILFLPVVNR